MINQNVIKAIADDNRLKIISILLKHRLCVRALSKQLNISEPATSQHIKILKEANLLIGEKQGYHIHYDVNRKLLHELAQFIESLSKIERAIKPSDEMCISTCHKKENCQCTQGEKVVKKGAENE